MKESIVFVAVILAFLGNISYLRDVINKKIKPHPYTWLVWSLVSGVTFFGALQKGAGVGAIPTGFAEAFTVIIFLYSLRYGFSQIKRRDTIFLVITLLGLIPWALTKDPTISVIIVVLIDLVAFVPTITKTWKNPTSETVTLYIMNVCRHVLTLFSIEAYNVATMLHSISMIIINTIMVCIIYFRKK